MPIFRRRHETDAATAPFFRACEHVDAAQRALLSAIPTSRRAGLSLAEALLEFRTHLTAAAEAIEGWTADPARRAVCVSALESARIESEKLRLSPDTLEFEALNARIGDILHPMESFADIEQEVRRR